MTERKKQRGKHNINRTVHTEQDKIRAVTTLLSVGREHPLARKAIQCAKDSINDQTIGVSTFAAWLKAYGDTVRVSLPDITSVNVSQVVRETRSELLDNLTTLRSKVLAAALKDDKINEAKLRDLMIAMGIADDHARNIESLTPETETALKELARACEESNRDLPGVLSSLAQAIRQRANVQNTPIFPHELQQAD